MAFGTWDTLFNLLLLLFWFRIWAPADESIAFNPYLAAANRAGSAIIGFLKPAFFILPDRAVAGIAFALVMALRVFASPRMESGWILHLGFAWRQPNAAALESFVLFSALSFGIFLFKLWGISLFFLRADAARDSRPTIGTLHVLSQPFIRLPYALRPPVLFVIGIGIVLALEAGGLPTRLNPFLNSEGWTPGGPGLTLPALLGAAICALSGWVEVLSVLVHLMVIMIIGSWVSMFTGSPGTAMACRDWTELLLGPLRRMPLMLGPLDLTPIVYIFALGALQGLLQGILFKSYAGIAGSL